MSKILTFVVALLTAVVAHGALLTDFANSFAQYQDVADSASDFDRDQRVEGGDFLSWQSGLGLTNQLDNRQGDANLDQTVDSGDLVIWRNQFAKPLTGIPQSVCFKLYFDPAGIVEGQVHAFVEGGNFALGNGNGLILADDRYDFLVDESIVSLGLRYQAKIHFTLKATADPPDSPVTLFGYQVRNNSFGPVPQSITGFEFVEDDFITVRNEDQTTTTFTASQLTDAPVELQTPIGLQVNTNTGFMSLVNFGALPLNMDGYAITSAAGALNPFNWFSLADQGLPGWAELGAASPNILAELNLLGSLSVGPGQAFALGTAFNSFLGVRDLRFSYSTAEGAVVLGIVTYIGAGNSGSVTALPELTNVKMAMWGLLAAGRRRLSAKTRRRHLGIPSVCDAKSRRRPSAARTAKHAVRFSAYVSGIRVSAARQNFSRLARIGLLDTAIVRFYTVSTGG